MIANFQQRAGYFRTFNESYKYTYSIIALLYSRARVALQLVPQSGRPVWLVPHLAAHEVGWLGLPFHRTAPPLPHPHGGNNSRSRGVVPTSRPPPHHPHPPVRTKEPPGLPPHNNPITQKEGKLCGTRPSRVVPHRSTTWARHCCLTSLFGWEAVTHDDIYIYINIWPHMIASVRPNLVPLFRPKCGTKCAKRRRLGGSRETRQRRYDAAAAASAYRVWVFIGAPIASNPARMCARSMSIHLTVMSWHLDF